MFKIDSKNTWFTSDTHFGHANIIKYCNRPYKNIQDMDTSIIHAWNENVKPNDIVIHLGDFSFNSYKYISILNGKIILIRGNHDKPKFDNLFEGVINFMPMKIGEFNCLLNHRPILFNDSYRKEAEPNPLILKKYKYIICGHVHEKWKLNEKNVNVGIDIWKRPIHIDELLSFMRTQELL